MSLKVFVNVMSLIQICFVLYIFSTKTNYRKYTFKQRLNEMLAEAGKYRVEQQAFCS